MIFRYNSKPRLCTAVKLKYLNDLQSLPYIHHVKHVSCRYNNFWNKRVNFIQLSGTENRQTFGIIFLSL